MYKRQVTGNYVLTIHFGSDIQLNLDDPESNFFAYSTSQANNSAGVLIFGAAEIEQAIYQGFILGEATPSITSLPLIAAPSSPVTLTSSGSSLTCSPGKYQVGASEASVSTYIYKLYLNNQLVSVRSYDPGKVIPSSMMGAAADLYPATLSATGITYDLSKASDYTARCEVTAVGYSSSLTSSSATITDSAYQARLAKAAADEETARLAAVAANYSKEARDARAKAAKYATRNP